MNLGSLALNPGSCTLDPGPWGAVARDPGPGQQVRMARLWPAGPGGEVDVEVGILSCAGVNVENQRINVEKSRVEMRAIIAIIMHELEMPQ